MFFLYFGKKVPVRRTGAYRHKKALTKSDHGEVLQVTSRQFLQINIKSYVH